jgi:hypothetical protein
VINTTNIKENIEQKEKHKGIQFLEELSLRDYFAAKAIQGICAAGPSAKWTSEMLATEAYELANAMLKAREQ